MSIEDSVDLLAAAAVADAESPVCFLLARSLRVGGCNDACRNETGLAPKKASERPPGEDLRDRAKDRQKSAMKSTRRMYCERGLAINRWYLVFTVLLQGAVVPSTRRSLGQWDVSTTPSQDFSSRNNRQDLVRGLSRIGVFHDYLMSSQVVVDLLQAVAGIKNPEKRRPPLFLRQFLKIARTNPSVS